MTKTEKVETLDKLIAELSSMEDPETYHIEFWTWREKAMRRLSRIFGNPSLQVNHFVATRYLPPNLSSYRSYYGNPEVVKNQVLGVTKRFATQLSAFVEEVPDDPLDPVISNSHIGPKKVFISHSSKDDAIGKEVINLLQLIGIKHSQIFYTSAAGYGVPLGKDWGETLKKEVSSEGVVISLLSGNYFTSQICILEMGATWMLSKLHVPVLIPPFTFEETNGVINKTQGFQILDRPGWSSLKKNLEKLFDLEHLDGDKWEPQRDSILERIEKHLSENN